MTPGRAAVVAAVQMEAEPADVKANLAMAEELAEAAVRDGATWIALPEFFTTGVGFLPELVEAALPADGDATRFLRGFAERHGVSIGGSFLCRDGDGHVRNAYVLATPEGIVGRHDKDIPTMWESCFYVGGTDDGVIRMPDGMVVGAAVCWELMRSATARRLRGRVDFVMAGSAWWSVPDWRPRRYFSAAERYLSSLASGVVPALARAVGAPVAHGAHAGFVSCHCLGFPVHYDGHFEGGAQVTAADGTVLAHRRWQQGAGHVIAEVDLGATASADAIPDRFWMHRRGVGASLMWAYQNALGRRWYRKHGIRAPSSKRANRTVSGP